jgi:hypothetical protein
MMARPRIPWRTIAKSVLDMLAWSALAPGFLVPADLMREQPAMMTEQPGVMPGQPARADAARPERAPAADARLSRAERRKWAALLKQLAD